MVVELVVGVSRKSTASWLGFMPWLGGFDVSAYGVVQLVIGTELKEVWL
jgi:hypothetical protein